MMAKYCAIILIFLLVGCSSGFNRSGTISQIRNQKVDLSEVEIEGGLEQAMASYEQFLRDPGNVSALTPEAIRRLADLKVEKEYGLVGQQSSPVETLADPESAGVAMKTVDQAALPEFQGEAESDADFEQRTTRARQVAASSTPDLSADPSLDDLERAGPLEAIALYQRLLDEYPYYPNNDQVLYQMSRAYEELGRLDEAMLVMGRLISQYPDSRYFDEVQFRRAESLFTRRKYLDAEEAYSSIVVKGVGSDFYQLALYKLGWTYYKQELYEDALHKYIALLDCKVDTGYDFEQQQEPLEKKRIDDTFRVISLSFSYLGGADATAEYFAEFGTRDYEANIYENLADYYFGKRRYSDAVASYAKFIELNPYHRKAPLFAQQVIDVNTAGGFPSLVVEAKKKFARDYALSSAYWNYFEVAERPEVIAGLKTNLTDLANHYHALYQNPKLKKKQAGNFSEATHWYREFLASFSSEPQAPVINYQLADLLLENKSYAEAAVEYERTAYDYAIHERSSKAGYAAVYAYRQQLATVQEDELQLQVKREVVRSSLKFAQLFPGHEKAAVVLGAAADDLYAIDDYENALYAALDLIECFPQADTQVTRSAWLVVGHSTYELEFYANAEEAYLRVLSLTETGAKWRAGLIDNLAAAIYRQGEEANRAEDYPAAAEHFIRVTLLAPSSALRSTAEYDAATAYIQARDWTRAAQVLTGFRNNFPEHELQHEVTKKLAYVYREGEEYALAADEFERIEQEADDDALKSEALLSAAELHQKAGQPERALVVYQRYIEQFPDPLDVNVETCQKIADLLKEQGQQDAYIRMLERIVRVDAEGDEQRTARTIFLAAKAGLVLAERHYAGFDDITLVQPFDKSLKKKKTMMKDLIQEFSHLIEYQVGEVTAASTWYLAEIYAEFSRSLMQSERPKGLDDIELEDYELALEENAYPFEEKAIEVHQSNLELIAAGVYNSWIDKSIERLAQFVPARYAKSEELCPLVEVPDGFAFYFAEKPENATLQAAEDSSAEVEPQEAETAVSALPEDTQQQSSGGSAGDVQQGGAQ